MFNNLKNDDGDNNNNDDLFAMFAFGDNKKKVPAAKPAADEVGSGSGSFLVPAPAVAAVPGNKRRSSATNIMLSVSDDQSSNSYGSGSSADLVGSWSWDDDDAAAAAAAAAMTSDYTSSVLAPASYSYMQGGAPKRMRRSYGGAPPSLAHDAAMPGFGLDKVSYHYQPLPLPPYYVGSSSGSSDDASVGSLGLLQADGAPQDGASAGDIWSLDELLMLAAAGAY
uniref:Uncharacterized protein n=1 Tax=Zea mays TaxID=4577 RepID=C4J0R5_MAIZE|nr:unknown [Zea mays]